VSGYPRVMAASLEPLGKSHPPLNVLAQKPSVKRQWPSGKGGDDATSVLALSLAPARDSLPAMCAPASPPPGGGAAGVHVLQVAADLWLAVSVKELLDDGGDIDGGTPADAPVPNDSEER
jgi:hypothetical protein